MVIPLRARGRLPELHVGLNIQKFLEPDAPWLARRRLEHKPPELGVKDGHRLLGPVGRFSEGYLNLEILETYLDC